MVSTCSHKFYRFHHYILEPAEKGWVRGRCKWCESTDLFYNENKIRTLGGKAQGPTSADKREYLRSKGWPLTNKYWDAGEKERVISSVKLIGVQATARKMNLPVSTVALWGKGQSPFVSRYTSEFKKKAVYLALTTKNIRRTAINLDIPRSVLQSWIKKQNACQ